MTYLHEQAITQVHKLWTIICDVHFFLIRFSVTSGLSCFVLCVYLLLQGLYCFIHLKISNQGILVYDSVRLLICINIEDVYA